MQRFKVHADITSALLRACDILAHKRPPLIDGKARDRAAFLRWRSECVELAHTLNRQETK